MWLSPRVLLDANRPNRGCAANTTSSAHADTSLCSMHGRCVCQARVDAAAPKHSTDAPNEAREEVQLHEGGVRGVMAPKGVTVL